MILYHGTAYDRSFTGDGDIRLIGHGEFGKDAFYLLCSADEAETRAYLNANQGFGEHADTRVLQFDLDTSGLNVFDFGDFSPEWLEFVYSHKMETEPDVIIGGLVDEMGRNPGVLNRWIHERKNGTTSERFTKAVVNQLKTDIKLQVAIKTQKGLDALKLIKSQDV